MWMVERLTGLYDNFPDCILALSETEEVIYCNLSFARLIGRPPDAITGVSFGDFIDPMNLYSQIGILKSMAGDSLSDLRLTLITEHETPVTLSVSMSRVESPNPGEPAAFLITGRDDSIVQEHMKKEAQYMAHELEQKRGTR